MIEEYRKNILILIRTLHIIGIRDEIVIHELCLRIFIRIRWDLTEDHLHRFFDPLLPCGGLFLRHRIFRLQLERRRNTADGRNRIVYALYVKDLGMIRHDRRVDPREQCRIKRGNRLLHAMLNRIQHLPVQPLFILTKLSVAVVHGQIRSTFARLHRLRSLFRAPGLSLRKRAAAAIRIVFCSNASIILRTFCAFSTRQLRKFEKSAAFPFAAVFLAGNKFTQRILDIGCIFF